MSERKPWEQLDGEPNAAYARFLVYLNLGRTRSLRQAAGLSATNRDKSRRKKKVSVSGTWSDDSAKFYWVDRARAWDIDKLTDAGYDAVMDFVNTLTALSHKALLGALNQRVSPKTLESVVELVNVLGTFIPAETVAAVRADAEQRRISAIGHSGSGDAGSRPAGQS